MDQSANPKACYPSLKYQTGCLIVVDTFRWTSARATALASLKALEGAYRGMKHPLSDRAIILVRAIQANLTAEPGTPAQVKELESYLVGDRIIAEAESPNGFGFEVKLRVPLMAALAALKQEQAAGSVKP